MNRTLGSLAAGAALALTGLVAGAPVASADAVDDYADVPFTIDVGGGIFYGGDTVPVKVATNDGSTSCFWTLKLDIAGGGSATSTSASPSFEAVLSSPVVSKETPTSVTATCVPAISGGSAATALQTTSASAKVTLLPRGASTGGDDDNGILPGTGGSSVWFIVAGGVLIAGGAAVTVAARRRSH